jgi:hypothetical protein
MYLGRVLVLVAAVHFHISVELKKVAGWDTMKHERLCWLEPRG